MRWWRFFDHCKATPRKRCCSRPRRAPSQPDIGRDGAQAIGISAGTTTARADSGIISVVGHAAHFLRRLDRVSDAHVELALTLYRDEMLLREVLNRASVPEGAERLAISLEHPVEGPFVVVTREGRFVTCLGPGMRASNLPVVTRERLDVAASTVNRMREELARVRELIASGADGQAALAFKRMQQQGPRFAREDAEVLLQIMPLIEQQCCDVLLALLHETHPRADRLARFRLEDPRRLSKSQQKALLSLGDAVWTIANLVGLVTPQMLRRNVPELPPERLMQSVTYLTAQWGTMIHIVRSLAFISKASKSGLAALKQREPSSIIALRIWRELAFGAIAIRSSKLRAEAMKALATGDPDQVDDPLESVATMVGNEVVRAIQDPDAEEEYQQLSRRYAVGLTTGRRPELTTEEERAAIPDDVAQWAWLLSPVTMHDPLASRALIVIALALPSLVKAPPEALYLPSAWAQRLIPERGVLEVAYWLRHYFDAFVIGPRRKPITRAAPKPGRNAPCPCGSGKKTKRCCG